MSRPAPHTPETPAPGPATIDLPSFGNLPAETISLAPAPTDSTLDLEAKHEWFGPVNVHSKMGWRCIHCGVPWSEKTRLETCARLRSTPSPTVKAADPLTSGMVDAEKISEIVRLAKSAVDAFGEWNESEDNFPDSEMLNTLHTLYDAFHNPEDGVLLTTPESQGQTPPASRPLEGGQP